MSFFFFFKSPLCFLVLTHTRATFIPGTRRITRTIKSQGDTQSIFAFISHASQSYFFNLTVYVYIYISLSLGTVPFENVYVDEASLRKTKRKKILFCLLFKMERKNLKNDRHVARESFSLQTRTRENGNSILIAPRFWSRDDFRRINVRYRSCESRTRSDQP